MPDHADAVVIGSRPNGLVAANTLADAGWDVVVLEAQDTPGGAVRTEELTEPGFHHDVFSAFYPLAAASPHLRALRLEEHGLRWLRSEAVVAHAFDAERGAALYMDVERTAASVAQFAPQDADAWRRWAAWWRTAGPPLIACLTQPFPPVRPAAWLARRLGAAGLLELGRLGVLPVRRHAQEEFAGEGAAMLLAGNALHADFTPETPGSTIFGWVLVGLGMDVGFPVPEGGAANLARALVRRLEARGGQLRCGEPAVRIDPRTRTVHTATGASFTARRAILANTSAPELYERLLPRDAVPERVHHDLARFEFDASTIKVDWALDGPIPWGNEECRRAGTVHVADSLDHLTAYGSAIQQGRIPDKPFLLLGQYARFDPSRMPPGKETAWAYAHLPQGAWTPDVTEPYVAAMEDAVEERAPGFKRLIRARHVLTPADMEARNRNLVGGAVNGGTAQLHQQLVFRPIPGLGRPETAVEGVYLASAAIHPGGGVHGAPGHNAARAALAAQKAPRRVRTAGTVLTRMVRSRKTDQRSR
ncbi:MAG: NAD(P)/FAD-dependent oxidoreductase [Solirubrobacterales bacterium]|nr:NAD(P)/FAD-dependent oxidoreductase [Solirubrobacterales bacterium]